ncbi:metallophosphoesterase [Cellulosilyticum ruminicola]|uniref:metallophosphoesterase n=1 Tax=Cellulosilyticum ruminicola TaxID=425254 RepID=UPI0006D271DE|nr:metallophosphoesterase [Cellulosilyticum ruminicola]
MKVFAIGDLHLSSTTNKPMDIFGENWAQHEKQIEAHWRETIGKEDLILIPGDISWAMRLNEAQADLDFLESLPGQKVCIRGNHDYWWDRPGKLNRQYDSLYFLQNTAYFIGDIAICGTRGWLSPNEVKWDEEDERLYLRELERLKLSLKAAMANKDLKEIWVMVHYPPTYNKDMTSPLKALLKEYPVTRVIYGHLHDALSWKEALKGEEDGIIYSLVAADYIGFKPTMLTEIRTEN